MTTALYLGRFQPFNNNHLRVLKEILEKHGRVIIALGSAQESGTLKNPLSPEERKEMIHRVLDAEGITQCEFSAVPDRPNDDVAWADFLKQHVPAFDVAYSNTERPQHVFEASQIAYVQTTVFQGPSSSEIRGKAARGEAWTEFVPTAVAAYLEDLGFPERMRKLEPEA